MAVATYRILIDWDGDGGLNVGDFETGLDSWTAGGNALPVLSQSSVRSHAGLQSALIAWTAYNPFQFDVSGKGFSQGTFGGTGFGGGGVAFTFGTASQGFDDGRFSDSAMSDPTVGAPRISRDFTGLVIGRQYTLTGWVYVPTGGMHVTLGVDGIGVSSPSTVLDDWSMLSYAFTALTTTHTLSVLATGYPLGTEQTWVDQIQVLGPGEDVTTRVLGLRTPLSFRYGRDIARALGAIAGGDTSLELNNMNRDYSPDNPGSVIAGYLEAGKPLLIDATFGGKSYVLFRGYLDDYTIVPDPANRSVKLTALDALAKIGEPTISTELYPSLQTGQGVHKILDAIGWPAEDRDIDPGATTMRYWWEEGSTGLEALTKILNSEGPPSLAFVDSGNKFVFRDRHHRFLRSASLNSQATFRDALIEPTFCAPMTYDIGWKDVVNSIDVSVDERDVQPVDAIFQTDDTMVLGSGESRSIRIEASDPFYGALTPVAGIDYMVQSGSVSVSLSRTSGQSAEIVVTAIGSAVVRGMALRARAVTVARTYQVHIEDASSIASHGIRSLSTDTTMPWANVNDVKAIGTIMIGQRSERLPIVTITVNRGNSARLTQILSRDLSDRIHIVEAETFTDDDYFIEQIEHTINDVGYDHRAAFGCERVRTQVTPLFTFDNASAGFDMGLFGLAGFDDPATLFILDQGKLDQNLLGH